MQGVGVGARRGKGIGISILASNESEADHEAHHVGKCRECEHGAQAGVWIACQDICFEACRHGFRPRMARMGWSVDGMQEIGEGSKCRVWSAEGVRRCGSAEHM